MGADPSGAGLSRLRLHVDGIVQGVGFRPFVHTLAARLGVAGWVGNDPEGVFIEAEAAPARLDLFVDALRAEAPRSAVVESVRWERIPVAGQQGFTIIASRGAGVRQALVAPDTATCDACMSEVRDPSDRRYRYPFTNCTDCGPRFTIVRGLPYDRRFTTMAGFAMCPECEGEYHDPADRRFHAQPVCCPVCGPRLQLVDAGGEATTGDPLAGAADALNTGLIVAVKGLGGYHLAAVASDEAAVGALRARKHREDKPFAVMAADVGQARALGDVGPTEEALLVGPARPIVLLPRRVDAPVADAVAPGNRALGVMLPYSPLHHLLLAAVGRPAVLTSGNVSDEPIAYRDDDALARLGGIADLFLTHDRPIHTRTDDSVVRTFRGAPLVLRRSRGYAPRPVTVARRFRRHVLACGAELKSTFCLGKDDHAFVSHHLGDLENYETLRAFTDGIDHYRRLFDVQPEVVAHDLHPEYLSTKYALDLDGVDTVAVQHHHAHIASCLADNRQEGPVIGIAFDGVGYGADATLWGGEILVAGLSGYQRAGHLRTVPMPGGSAAVREPWRMALSHLDAAFDGDIPRSLAVAARHQPEWERLRTAARAGVNSPLTSSVGRLFDAVAAVVGVRDAINYEGQAAVELEQMADPAEDGAYRLDVVDQESVLLDGATIVRAVVADLAAGVAVSTIAARFHNGVAAAMTEAARAVRERTGLNTVALSGGVFQNLLLLERSVSELAGEGFRVLTHSQIPPNDGGISLGQAVIAATMDAGEPERG